MLVTSTQAQDWDSFQEPSSLMNSTWSAVCCWPSGVLMLTVASAESGIRPGTTGSTTSKVAPDSAWDCAMTSNSSGADSLPWTSLTFSSCGTLGSEALVRISLSCSTVGISVVTTWDAEVSPAVLSALVAVELPSSEDEQAARVVAAARARMAALSLMDFTDTPHIGGRGYFLHSSAHPPHPVVPAQRCA